MFRKYMHVERFGNDEVQGIELGTCHIFPKLDGTNAQVWVENGELRAGSRNRKLSLEEDNAGFFAYVQQDTRLKDFFEMYPGLRLYGEWLVPHSLKTYREDAWNRFYVFDVYEDEVPLPYENYVEKLQEFDLDFIPPLAVINNAQYDLLLKQLDKNGFLITDGKGVGEGLVIKNYDFKNRFGRQVWAKIVTNSFKESHVKAMGPSILNGAKMVEEACVEEFVTPHLVDKVYSKISNENEGWNSRHIPRLLQTVYYDLVKEESWDMVKKHKNPTINFKTLNHLTIQKVKEIRPELF